MDDSLRWLQLSTAPAIQR